MKKRTVGIYANYDGSEQTLCAEFLAGYISRGYRYVKWFVPDRSDIKGRARGFSHKWDSEVVPWRGNLKNAKKDAAVCGTFFFFEPNEEMFDRLPRNAVTTLVVDPNNRTEPYLDFVRKCSFTLWPNRKSISIEKVMNAYHWPFDPTVPLIPKGSPVPEKRLRLFFPTFGLTETERDFVQKTAETVRRDRPNVKTVVGYYDATVMPSPGLDSRVYDWRLLRYMRNSDRIIDLNPRPLLCLFAAFAGGLEIPWTGYDLVPNSDELNRSYRHLIAESADPESTALQIVDRLDSPFQGDLDSFRGNGIWDRRRTEFLRVTNIVLGNKTKF